MGISMVNIGVTMVNIGISMVNIGVTMVNIGVTMVNIGVNMLTLYFFLVNVSISHNYGKRVQTRLWNDLHIWNFPLE
jgi:hypothetical protein